jgi:hypothetical protein
MNLTQTALTSPSKRKASAFESDDAENVDPIIFLSPKRSKNPDGSSTDTTYTKPVNFFLTKAPPSPNDFSCLKPVASPASVSKRPILTARSPAAPKLDTGFSKQLSSAPAGRSPTRKRIGILNRRKTGSPFTRVEPPKLGAFGSSAKGLGFSIDAALHGTIPSSAKPQRAAAPSGSIKDIPLLHRDEKKDSWFFDIHEDTPEEEATNLMEHGACTLDISSDEESRRRERDERGKENIPPLDDISQTRVQLSSFTEDSSSMSMGEMKAHARVARRRKEVDEGAIDIDRCPLGEMAAEDFYAEGCDGSSVFLIPSDPNSPEEEDVEEPLPVSTLPTFDFLAEVKGKGKGVELDVDELMRKDDWNIAPKAKVLEPIEKADEGFSLWESGSDHGAE